MRLLTITTGLLCFAVSQTAPKEQLIKVELSYRAPADGSPKPNFSPYGTQVTLTAAAAGAVAGPKAKTGTIKVGPDTKSWMPVAVTSDASCPNDLCRLVIDRNRNGNFNDDGPAFEAVPSQNEKTKAWWSSFNKIEVSVPYGRGVTEPAGRAEEPESNTS